MMSQYMEELEQVLNIFNLSCLMNIYVKNV